MWSKFQFKMLLGRVEVHQKLTHKFYVKSVKLCESESNEYQTIEFLCKSYLMKLDTQYLQWLFNRILMVLEAVLMVSNLGFRMIFKVQDFGMKFGTRSLWDLYSFYVSLRSDIWQPINQSESQTPHLILSCFRNHRNLIQDTFNAPNSQVSYINILRTLNNNLDLSFQ